MSNNKYGLEEETAPFVWTTKITVSLCLGDICKLRKRHLGWEAE